MDVDQHHQQLQSLQEKLAVSAEDVYNNRSEFISRLEKAVSKLDQDLRASLTSDYQRHT